MEQQPLYGMEQIVERTILDNWKGREGPFYKGFLLNTKRNKNGWRVTKESIELDMADFINHPGVYMKKNGIPDHPGGQTYKENMSNQELYRVSNIIDLDWDPITETLYSIEEPIDEDFKTLYEAGKINFRSPGIWPVKMRHVGTTEDGRPALDVDRFRALHTAYIDDPAFGDEARTVSTCDADGITCKMRLFAKSEALAADELAPLMQVPLIRKTLNQRYTPCQIKNFHAELKASSDTSCVSTRLKAISEDNPDQPVDWQLAAAYAMCQNEGLEILKKSMLANA